MINQLKITIVQLNPILGNIKYNYNLIVNVLNNNKLTNTDLIVFSELSMTGYPVEDLVLKKIFQETVFRAVKKLAKYTFNRPAILIGFPYKKNNLLFNAIGLLENGKITEIRLKHKLSNYGVFDEKRIFNAGPLQNVIFFKGVKLGLLICEDIWSKKVSLHLKNQGAEILISLNCSPFERDKIIYRQSIMRQRVIETSLPLVYLNQIGGQDELVFDGGSFVLDRMGNITTQLPLFIKSINIIIFNKNENNEWIPQKGDIAKVEIGLKGVYGACVLGLRDYIYKNNFSSVIIGLSGGIDSAITAAIAVDAIGKDKVNCIMLNHKYTSKESLKDAKKCAKFLGIKYEILSIKKIVNSFTINLSNIFKNTKKDITEENLQSRIRSTILMSISNKFGSMVLSTSNKSEISVGYSTIYGDMCGGFNPIKDIYKTDIFKLCLMRNEYHPSNCLGNIKTVIPKNIIIKSPTAELKFNQLDLDKLPSYDILDDILYSLIELDLSYIDCIKNGTLNGFNHKIELIKKIANMVYNAEYKRKQSPLGTRVSYKGFGNDRRYPATNGFR